MCAHDTDNDMVSYWPVLGTIVCALILAVGIFTSTAWVLVCGVLLTLMLVIAVVNRDNATEAQAPAQQTPAENIEKTAPPSPCSIEESVLSI
jgi:hypothetical protein